MRAAALALILVIALSALACSSSEQIAGHIAAMDVRDERLYAITIRDERGAIRSFTVKDPAALNAYVSVRHLQDEHQAINVPVTLVLEKSKVVRIDD